MGRKKKSRRRQQQHSTGNDESLTITEERSSCCHSSEKFIHCTLGNQKTTYKRKRLHGRKVFVFDRIDTHLTTVICNNNVAKKYSIENSHWFHNQFHETYFDIIPSNNDDDWIQVKSNWLTHLYSIQKTDFHEEESSKCMMNHSTEIKKQISCFQSSLKELKHQFRPIMRNVQTWTDKPDHPPTTTVDVFAMARKRANPMECLGEKQNNNNNPFINRSAMKLANMDALLQYSLTKKNNAIRNPPQKKFVFVDLCGAPGGFTEYIIHRFHHYQGYGMSLQGTNSNGRGLPWRIGTNKWKRTTKRKQNFHICKGINGDGDVTNWDNILCLKHKIYTVDKHVDGVDLVLADGGFDAQRDQEDQEQITLPLLIGQIAASLVLLRENGNFVLKVFGFQHRTTRHIITYLMKHLFHQTIFLKPIISRPASSERYMVCLGYHRHSSDSEIYHWRQEMLATTDKESCNKTNDLLDCCYAETCMDLMDRDMLLLNIQACKAILSELKKNLSKQTNNDTQEEEEEEEEEIDGNLYKEAWEIDQLFLS